LRSHSFDSDVSPAIAHAPLRYPSVQSRITEAGKAALAAKIPISH
jgi:hypothetical protein